MNTKLEIENRDEIIIFLDDDKGQKTGNTENTQGVFLRTFEKLDCKFFKLAIRHLEREKAQNWHSSQKCGLHHSNSFKNIVKTLGKCKSRVFTYRLTEAQIDGNRDIIESKMKLIPEQFKDYWPTDRRQSLLLFWSIFWTTNLLARSPWHIKKPKKITFIIDSMDFFPEDSASIYPVTNLNGMFFPLDIHLVSGITLSVLSFKKRVDVPLLMKLLINLVDGESWLFGRLWRGCVDGKPSIDSQALEYSKLDSSGQAIFEFKDNVLEDYISTLKSQGVNYKKLSSRLNFYNKFIIKCLNKNTWAMNSIYLGDTLKRLPSLKSMAWSPFY